MELAHIFHKGLAVNEKNIFTVNLAEKTEVEEVKFKKSKKYAVNGISIKQDIDSSVAVVTDTDRQKVLSKLIQKIVKKTKPDLDLKIYSEEMALDKIISFQKKTTSEVPLIKLTFCNTNTKKQEIEFYYYMTHLEKIVFLWLENDLELRYSVELSTDQKNK